MKKCLTALVAVFLCAACLALLTSRGAYAHDWYSRTNCCNGSDCAPVPLDAEWVTMEANGYRVFLTVEQAKLVNPEATYPINELIPWHSNKIRVPPVLKAGETYGKTIYHLCISTTGTVYCLFPVPVT